MPSQTWRTKRARTAAVARWCATGQATEAIVTRLPFDSPAIIHQSLTSGEPVSLCDWLQGQPEFACLPPAARRIVARGVIRAIEADLLRQL